uniref:Uncharacterized protein n=1 Tax=Globodera rostochiensis TaxID=31243 RepID=A0A914GQN0_GLORO
MFLLGALGKGAKEFYFIGNEFSFNLFLFFVHLFCSSFLVLRNTCKDGHAFWNGTTKMTHGPCGHQQYCSQAVCANKPEWTGSEWFKVWQCYETDNSEKCSKEMQKALKGEFAKATCLCIFGEKGKDNTTNDLKFPLEIKQKGNAGGDHYRKNKGNAGGDHYRKDKGNAEGHFIRSSEFYFKPKHTPHTFDALCGVYAFWQFPCPFCWLDIII